MAKLFASRDGRARLLRRDPDPRRLRLRGAIFRSSASGATCASARSTKARATSSGCVIGRGDAAAEVAPARYGGALRGCAARGRLGADDIRRRRPSRSAEGRRAPIVVEGGGAMNRNAIASRLAESCSGHERGAALLLRLLVAVSYIGLGVDRGDGRAPRPQRRLAGDPARRHLPGRRSAAGRDGRSSASTRCVDFERSARHSRRAAGDAGQVPDPDAERGARLLVWLRERGDLTASHWARHCLRAYFARGVELSDPAELKTLAAEFGLESRRGRGGWNDPALKAALKRANDEAIAHGVFGSPFFFVDGEPFWGNDRRPQIERWLAEGASDAPARLSPDHAPLLRAIG